MADTIHTDVEDLDDFDTPQTASAPIMPPAAADRAVRAHSGPAIRASGEISDDGVQFGADPDFVVEANRRSGATFDIPAATDILDVRPHRGGRGGRGRGAVNSDDNTDSADTSPADGDSENVSEPDTGRDARRQHKRNEREQRKVERDQRLQDRLAERDRQREARANAKADAGTADAGNRRSRRRGWRRTVVAAGAAALIAVVGAGAYMVLRQSNDAPTTASPRPPTTASPAPQTAQFAAGDACRPGTTDGATILDSTSSTTRTTPESAISALEHAYYAQRSGAAVAAVWAKGTAGVDPAAIQKGIDQHFAGRESQYCVQVTPAADPGVFVVKTIETDGSAQQTGTQQITLRSNNGIYEVVGLRNLSS